MREACQRRFEYVEVGEAVEFRCKSHGAQQTAGGTELAMVGSRKGL